ncbi:hypothetical protein R5R35_014731 [Gryllus longicercus]|uniref:Ketoreductase domain-containing protein n=1 Tax=Gryllus longicercus TaxID=2509291 RepID=A0AAN9VUH9_9ORTH
MSVLAFLGALFFSRWVVLVATAAAVYRFWYKLTTGVCTSTRRLDGKTVLITGANTGIGLETARDMARRGARVLIACRDPERGQQALAKIRAEASGGATVALLALDLGDLQSVRACAAKVRESEPRLDVLINNAGAGGVGAKKTEDGLHRGLQVNHFGPFLFTLLLVDLLKKSAPSRIIFVSSIAHEYSKLSAEELDHEVAKNIDDTSIYGKTKLANVLVSNELARRLNGTGVTVNSLHPGAVQTDIFRHIPYGIDKIVHFLFGLFFKSAEEGAQTSIHLAVSEQVEGITGAYFSDCKERRMAKAAYDKGLARAVWEKSERLVRLADDERPTYA